MGKIVTVQEAVKKAKHLQKHGKKIVLAGGCFDILHAGHLLFLQNAKKHADYLFILLESDEAVRLQKGENRPVNAQSERANILASVAEIDYIIRLNRKFSDSEYDRMINTIKPAIIATTKDDPNRHHKERQAKSIKGIVVDVIERIPDLSTTHFAGIIEK